MIADWNRTSLLGGTVFHFKNSLRPFVMVDDLKSGLLFLDVDEMTVYNYDDLEHEGLFFYKSEEDEDFMGVEVDGHIEWV